MRELYGHSKNSLAIINTSAFGHGSGPHVELILPLPIPVDVITVQGRRASDSATVADTWTSSFASR